MLTVFIPQNEPTTFLDGNATYQARIHNGRLVVDVPQQFFRASLLLGKNGLLWERENHEVMAWMGANDGAVMSCNAFPGADRPPPVAPVATDSAPKMVRVLAPDGVTSFSHDGVEHKVAKDGSVTVSDPVADVLRSHGFRSVA